MFSYHKHIGKDKNLAEPEVNLKYKLDMQIFEFYSKHAILNCLKIMSGQPFLKTKKVS